jgi:hypothetical protein
MSHDARCEHSKTKRCRCDCGGAQHGIAQGTLQRYAGAKQETAFNANREFLHDPIPQESNLGIHHWFEAWVNA